MHHVLTCTINPIAPNTFLGSLLNACTTYFPSIERKSLAFYPLSRSSKWLVCSCQSSNSESRNKLNQATTKYNPNPLQKKQDAMHLLFRHQWLGARVSVRVRVRIIRVMGLGVKISVIVIVKVRVRVTAMQPFKDLWTFHKVPAASHWITTHPVLFNPQKHTRNVVRYQMENLSGLGDHSPPAYSGVNRMQVTISPGCRFGIGVACINVYIIYIYIFPLVAAHPSILYRFQNVPRYVPRMLQETPTYLKSFSTT